MLKWSFSLFPWGSMLFGILSMPGGAAGSVAAGVSGNVAGVTGTTTKSSISSTTAKSSGGAAIDSTALDALFREAADEHGVGE